VSLRTFDDVLKYLAPVLASTPTSNVLGAALDHEGVPQGRCRPPSVFEFLVGDVARRRLSGAMGRAALPDR